MIHKLLQTSFHVDDANYYVLDTYTINNEIVVKKDLSHLFRVAQDTTYYVDNLNLLYIYIVRYLLDVNIKFDYSYKNGKCANIKAEHNKSKIYFVNFKSKFGVDWCENYEDNKRLLDYALAHYRTKLSLGADAYNEFLHTIFKRKENELANYKLIREDFPIFNYDAMLIQAKRNVAGYQSCKAGSYTNIYEYDISGSYPASALNNTPVGLPYTFNNIADVPKTYFKIIKFTYHSCKLKPNGIAFVNTTALGTLVLTEKLFKCFLDNYDAQIKIIKIMAFRTRKSLFAKFINDTVIKGKQQQSDKLIASYNKLIGNSVIGYLGRNTEQEDTQAVLGTGNCIEFKKTISKIDPIYLPAYLAILDASKSRFLNVIKRYQHSIIYSNTDGILVTRPLTLELLNINNTNTLLGNFKLKNMFHVLTVRAINEYAGVNQDGEVVNVISGVKLHSTITPEQLAAHKFSYYFNEPTADGRMRQINIELDCD